MFINLLPFKNNAKSTHIYFHAPISFCSIRKKVQDEKNVRLVATAEKEEYVQQQLLLLLIRSRIKCPRISQLEQVCEPWLSENQMVVSIYQKMFEMTPLIAAIGSDSAGKFPSPNLISFGSIIISLKTYQEELIYGNYWTYYQNKWILNKRSRM